MEEGKSEIGFICYQDKDGNPIIYDYYMTDCMSYAFNPSNIYFKPPKPDTRSKFRKLYDEIKRRLDNTWYSLKGGEFD